jgi:serine/threonine-protein kinase RsbT
MIQTSDAPNLSRRLLDALTSRVHLVDPRLRDRIAGLGTGRTPRDELEALVGDVVNVVALFGGAKAGKLLSEIDAETGGALSLAPHDALVHVEEEASVVEVRRQAGLIAAKLGFRVVHRTKIVTAASELARNIHMYAGRGEIEIKVVSAPRPGMLVRAKDSGPGIPDLDDVMGGRTRSKRGMGLGLRGVKAMADDFTIASAPGRGTSVTALFCFPGAAAATS